MPHDVSALIRADHNELDRALVALLESSSAGDLAGLLEVVRLALAVHVAAESKVLEVLHARGAMPRALTSLYAQIRGEHAAQQDIADALAALELGSSAWFSRALDLRMLVLDHASRSDLLRWTFDDHVPASLRRELAAIYATERMRVLASTAPVLVARAASLATEA